MLKKDKPVSRGKRRKPAFLDAPLAVPPEARLSRHEWRLAFGEKPRVFRTAHFRRWQLQDAKAKFSEVFERAFKDGPQVVTRRNKEAVVIIPEEQYRKLAGGDEKHTPNLFEVLLKCPKGPELKIAPRGKDDDILNLPRVFD